MKGQGAIKSNVDPRSAGGSVTFAPLLLRKWGGMRRVVLPGVVVAEPFSMQPGSETHTRLQRALGRAHRWLAQLESGAMPSVKAIAIEEGLDQSYVSRILGLTLIAPEIVAKVLEDTVPAGISLTELAVDPFLLWDTQKLAKSGIRIWG